MVVRTVATVGGRGFAGRQGTCAHRPGREGPTTLPVCGSVRDA